MINELVNIDMLLALLEDQLHGQPNKDMSIIRKSMQQAIKQANKQEATIAMMDAKLTQIESELVKYRNEEDYNPLDLGETLTEIVL